MQDPTENTYLTANLQSKHIVTVDIKTDKLYKCLC